MQVKQVGEKFVRNSIGAPGRTLVCPHGKTMDGECADKYYPGQISVAFQEYLA
jgi:hypothetical protein